jgi:uncharacterized RDD family membrane protein YckC
MRERRPDPRPRVLADDLAVPHEARDFQGDRAGFVSRALSNAIDVAAALVVVGSLYVGLVVVAIVLSPTNPQVPSTPFLWFVVATGVVLWLSFTVAWATTGRTIGERVMGLRVVNFRGRRLLWPGAALRATFCLFFLPGLFWVIVSGQNRSLQDTVLRTQVVYDWTKRTQIVPPDDDSGPGTGGSPPA